MEDTEANFLHLESEYWIGILNTNELKDERKKASDLILKNKPSTRKKSDCAEDYDSGGSLRVTFNKNKARKVHNTSKDDTSKHQLIQRYCFICKNFGMPKVNYGSKPSENLYGLNKSSNSTNKDLGGGLVKWDAAFKQL